MPRSFCSRIFKMKFVVCLFVFALVAHQCSAQIPSDMSGLKSIVCSDDAEMMSKVKSCAEMMPDEVKEAVAACGEEAAPGLGAEDLRAATCDPEQDVGKKMDECMRVKKAEVEKLPPESMSKLMEAVSCFTELM